MLILVNLARGPSVKTCSDELLCCNLKIKYSRHVASFYIVVTQADDAGLVWSYSVI